MQRSWSLTARLLIVAATLWIAPRASAQPPPVDAPADLGGGILQQLNGNSAGGQEGSELTLSGEYKVAKGKREGQLFIRAELLPTWHTYSTTQKSGGPMASKIVVEPSAEATITRPFVADRAPHVKQEEVFPVPSEKFEEEVIWSAPFQINEGADPDKLRFTVKYSGQVCQDNGSCIPINRQPVEVKFAGTYDAPAKGEITPRMLHAKVRGQIAPRTAKPGDKVTLSLTAEPTAPGYHVYAYAERDPKKVSKPTLIGWKNDQGWSRTKPAASEQPIEHASKIEQEPIQYYYEKTVTWTVEVQIPPDAAPGGYELRGVLGLQTCNDKGCDPPTAVEFSGVIEVGKLEGDSQPEPLSFVPSNYKEAAKLAEGATATGPDSAIASSAANQPQEKSTPPSSEASSTGLQLDQLIPVGAASKDQPMAIILPTAFLAGFLLNFMPCVLPVIGLKIVSFVNQSGESRSRIFMLNVWYSLGVLSVFMVLASLAVVFGFSWGDQFRSAAFNVVLACVVFAFALSFLGVWEIPLPGFVGSAGVGSAAEREGFTGAFFKGALATVLATPCGGPLLGPALAWAVAQPAHTAYLGFASVGLGMAFPYLVIGAFPKLVAFLPKPGDWMETFKQVMGFVLMGTVVFILTLVPITLVIPTVAMIMGLWAALWWIGRVPVWDDVHKRIRAWAGGAAFATLIGLVSYLWLDGIMESRFQREVDASISKRLAGSRNESPAAVTTTNGDEIPWQVYSHDLLAKMLADKRTVFVDFTADWCLTCKLNEKVALEVPDTREFVEKNQIAMLKADLTNEAPEADELKARLGGSSIPIPYYAVFPANAPNQPIVFDGPITKSKVIETLRQAMALGSDGEKSQVTIPVSRASTELPWQTYSHALLHQALTEQRTVFVDFTADWCPTCKTNEMIAFEASATRNFVQTNQIVMLKADLTRDAFEADELKAKLGGNSVPLPYYAIFTARTPNRPIVFGGKLITSTGLIEKMREAMSSANAPAPDA